MKRLLKTIGVLGSWFGNFGLKLTGSWFSWFKAPTDYQNCYVVSMILILQLLDEATLMGHVMEG